MRDGRKADRDDWVQKVATRRRILKSTGLAGAVGLAGCTGDNAQNTDAGGNGGNGGGNGGSSDADPVRFWSYMATEPGSNSVEAINTTIDAFNEENPNTPVEMEGVPYAKVKDKLITSATGGNAPDLVEADFTWTKALASVGVLEPWENHLPDGFTDKMLDGLVEAGSFDVGEGPKLYNLLWNPFPNALVINNELFEEAGYDPSEPPETFEEVKQIALDIGDLGDDTFGLGLQLNKRALSGDYLHYYLWGFGSQVLDDDGNVVINQQGTIDTLNYMNDIVQAGASPEGQGIRDLRTIFSQGRLGMMFEGIWFKGIAAGHGMERDTWSMALCPAGPEASGYPGVVNASHDGLLLTKQSTKKEKATKLAEYLMTNYEAEKRWFEATGFPPGIKSMYEKEPFKGDPLIELNQEQSKAVRNPNTWGPNREAVNRSVMEGVQRVVLQGADPEATMERTAKSIENAMG